MSQFQNRSRRTGAKPNPSRLTRCDVRRTRRWFTTLLWFSVVVGLPEMRGRSVSSGLAEADLDMTEAADLVVGTSSGATAAAHVRSGIPAAELLASVLSPPVQPVRQNREWPASLPMATVFERMRAIGAAATSAADLRRAMGAFGLESDSTLGPAAGQRRAMVAGRSPRPEWPDRPMIVVAVDAHTGELAAFDRDSGVDLVDAVTASTALPGMAPTHNINGTHYINGGVRSSDNADLASGYANVVVLSPFGGRSQTPPERGTDPAPVRGPAQTTGMGHGPGQPGRSPAQAGQPRRGDHTGRRFPSRNGHEPRPIRQPASPPPVAGFAQGKHEATRVRLLSTIARRRPAPHRHL